MSSISKKVQLKKLSDDYYSVISILKRYLRIGEGFSCNDISIIELGEQIYVARLVDGNIVSTIFFPNDDNRMGNKIFSIQIRDRNSRLTNRQRVCLDPLNYDELVVMAREPNQEECDMLTEMFDIIKNGKSSKKNIVRKRALVPVSSYGDYSGDNGYW